MNRITDEKLKNKRFRQTEETIIITFFSVKESLSLSHFFHTAHISRSTLYRHHKNLSEVAPDYEAYILYKCKKIMHSLMNNPKCQLRTLYSRILILMSANRLVMRFLLKYGRRDFFERMIITIKPRIIATNKITDGEMFKIYTKEIAGLVEEWGRAGFNKNTIVSTVDKIMFLTNTAHIRLSPLKSFNQQG